jgi:hypothetical protein
VNKRHLLLFPLDLLTISLFTVGNNARKAVADGYPLENVITSDLHQGACAPRHERCSASSPILTEFADLGHKLFKTTQETYPIAFVPGDIFDPKHLEVVPPFTVANALTGPAPALRSLTSLNPLHGRVSVIHASFFFHLFNEENQLHAARALAGLLSAAPGSMIFGQHLALPEKGFRSVESYRLFCHSPATWADLWDGQVFEKGSVKVQTHLVEISSEDRGVPIPYASLLIWSVARL